MDSFHKLHSDEKIGYSMLVIGAIIASIGAYNIYYFDSKPAPAPAPAPAPKPEPYAANTYGKDGAGTYKLGYHYKVIYVGAAMIAIGAYFVYGKDHKEADSAEFYEF
jgi:hypothetical protein